MQSILLFYLVHLWLRMQSFRWDSKFNSWNSVFVKVYCCKRNLTEYTIRFLYYLLQSYLGLSMTYLIYLICVNIFIKMIKTTYFIQMLPKFYKIKINGKLLPPSKIFCNVEKMCIDAVCVKNNELAHRCLPCDVHEFNPPSIEISNIKWLIYRFESLKINASRREKAS